MIDIAGEGGECIYKMRNMRYHNAIFVEKREYLNCKYFPQLYHYKVFNGTEKEKTNWNSEIFLFIRAQAVVQKKILISIKSTSSSRR
jgi:hypothetical protein